MAPSSSSPKMKLNELDLVWARQRGYPWWPAVLSPCPVEPNMGYWMAGTGKKVRYHCTYVGWDKQRVWLEEKDIRKVKREDLGEGRKKEYLVKNKSFKQQHIEALELSGQILDDPNNPFAYLVKIVETLAENVLDPGIGLTTEEKSNCRGDVAVIKPDSQPEAAKFVNKIEGEVDKESKNGGKMKEKIMKFPQSNKKKKTNVGPNSSVTKMSEEKVKDDESKCNEDSTVGESYFHTIAEKVKNPRKRKPVEKFNNFDEINAGKIGKIKKFLIKQKKPPVSMRDKHHASSLSSAPLPVTACQCAGCLLADCGQCKFCEDKVCFGGEGKLNQRCSRRMCHGKDKDTSVAKEEGLVGTSEATAVEDGVDILKVANKGKKAEIETDELSDEEVPLVINLDNVAAEERENKPADNDDHTWSEFATSPTQDELPTSSTISYKKSVDEKVVSNNSVWEDVKFSLLDVQDSLSVEAVKKDVLVDKNVKISCVVDEAAVGKDSLGNDLDAHVAPSYGNIVDAYDSSDDDFDISIHPSSSLLLTSPTRSNSSITISTPTQSPDRGKEDFVDESVKPINSNVGDQTCVTDALPIYFHSDWIDDIIECNIKENCLDDGSIHAQHACTKDVTTEVADKNKIKPIEEAPDANYKRLKISKKHSTGKTPECKTKSKFVVSKCHDTNTHATAVPKKVNHAAKLQIKERPKKVTEIDLFSGSDVKKTKINKAYHASSFTSEEKVEVSTKDKKHDKGVQKVIKDVKKKINACLDKIKDVKKEKESKCTNANDFKAKESNPTIRMMPTTPKTKSVGMELSEKKAKTAKKKSKISLKETEEKETYPESLKSSLGSFKIPKSQTKKKNEDKAVDIKVNVDTEKNRKRKSDDENRDQHSKRIRTNRDAKQERIEGYECKTFKKKSSEDGALENIEKKRVSASSSWVDAVDWSDQVAPDSTTGDEPLININSQERKESNVVEAESDCSSGSGDEDISWKRRKKNTSKKEFGGNLMKFEALNSRVDHKSLPIEPRSCHERNESTNYSETLPTYTLSVEALDNLEPSSVFDSHCHMDFILFQRLPHMELESYDQFLHQNPLMSHPSLEGFITNFCSPRLWMEHLSSPTPLVHSLLSRTSVFHTIGCHPHFARDLLVSRNYRLLEQLIEKAGSRCVAVGECGLDTSGKNRIGMADQLESFKMQVKLAIRIKKPLVLHIRGAEKEAIKALKEVKLPHDWPIHRHCWNDTWAVCEEWMAMFTNSVVGITPLVTFSNTLDIEVVSRKLPLDKMVLETDAPYFIPRGGGRDGYLGHTTREFSLPMHVVNVAAQVAAIRGCKMEDVLRASRDNIARVYKV